MIGEKARTRQQGIEEQAKQALIRDRISPHLKQTIERQQQKEETIDRIRLNKLAYRNEQAQKREERALEMQVGLPEMGHIEDSQEKKQANPHQDQVFAAAKMAERSRMSKEQADQAKAEQEHGFKMDAKEADQRVLEAGNNPTQKKKDLNKELTKEEKQIKAVFENPNIPITEKVKFFKKMLRDNKKKGTLKTHKQQMRRGEKLIKGINQQEQKSARLVLNKAAGRG